MTQLTENLFAVEVPDKVENLNLYRINNYAIMLEWDDVERPLNPHTCVRVDEHHGDLKEYTWPKILCTTKEATEEQAKGIAEWFQIKNEIGWKNYCDPEPFRYPFKDYKYSIRSLLTSNGLDERKNYLLLKKEK